MINEQIFKLTADKKPETPVYGKKIGLLAKIFGCWHFKLSRPMTIEKQTYCACVKCGARIRFDTEKLTTVGDFYYPPMIPLYSNK